MLFDFDSALLVGEPVTEAAPGPVLRFWTGIYGGADEGNSVVSSWGLHDGLRQSGSALGAWAVRPEAEGSGYLEAKGAAEAASRAKARDYEAVP